MNTRMTAERPSERTPGETRRHQIVETVLALVAQHGTEGVSAQLVADAIGLTQPAVFRHFPNKEAMWLEVMDWLEQRLVTIYAAINDERKEPSLVVLGRMFLAHARLIERYPALAKLVLSDHLRLQYPRVQARFGAIHRAYTARLCTVIERGRADGTISHVLAPQDAAMAFLSLIQGLGFQFAVARLPMKFLAEAERVLALYLQALSASTTAAAHARNALAAAKRPAH